MRIILFTGKGGVGKTSVAAATAVRCAQKGRRTAVMSTDAAHSLGDALSCQLDGRPRTIAPNLDALEVDVHQELREGWGRIRSFIVQNLRKLTDFSQIEAEELAVWPGMDELFSLLRLKALHREGRYDVVIMDCAPTGSTVRMLSMPDVMRWYMTRLFHVERRMMKWLRPVLSRAIDPVLPDDEVFDAVENLYNRMDGVKELLCDPATTTVRLVVNPEKMVIRETQRAHAYLCLFGFSVDAVVVNRILPADAEGAFLDAWRRSQAQYVEEIERAFAPVPLLRVRQRSGEVVGLDALAALAEEIYGHDDPARGRPAEPPISISRENGRYILRVALPFVAGGEVDVWSRGDELTISVGNVRRSLVLPHALAARPVIEARLCDGALRVSFGGDGHDRGDHEAG